MKKAWFAIYPRCVEDLCASFRPEDVHPYVIAEVVELQSIPYENFLYGMDVERDYLKKAANNCSRGEVYRCVLVKRKGAKPGGILVVPDREGAVTLAAKADPVPFLTL